MQNEKRLGAGKERVSVAMKSDKFENLLKEEKEKQAEFMSNFNSFRGSIEERLLLVGGNCFTKKQLKFYDLEQFQDVLDDEDMLSLIRFKNKVLRSNQCLGYADKLINPFGRSLNSSDYSYLINIHAKNNMFEFCQIYYLIFERLINEGVFPRDSQCKKEPEITATFGRLHDYRGVLNHNTLDRGWISPKGTTIDNLRLTQQEAIDELFAMSELAQKRQLRLSEKERNNP